MDGTIFEDLPCLQVISELSKIPRLSASDPDSNMPSKVNMFLLTEWEGRTGKYLARGHDVRTERSEVRASWPRAKYFLVRPDQTQLISILSYEPAAFLCVCFLIVFFGDERLCFARIFKKPMIVRHSCEKPVKFYHMRGSPRGGPCSLVPFQNCPMFPCSHTLSECFRTVIFRNFVPLFPKIG